MTEGWGMKDVLSLQSMWGHLTVAVFVVSLELIEQRLEGCIIYVILH